MNSELAEIKIKTEKAESAFGPSFCLAKWYHANIYLQLGETHSCYHPEPHKIDIETLQQDPSALHNTITKKHERSLMLEGKKPKGCQYCWNIEGLNKNLISDRMIRTASLYSEERISEIKFNSRDFNVSPDYVEVSFSNLCNFMCGYCHPKASSRFQNEIQSFGPYPTKIHDCSIKNLNILKEESNPYLEAWWRWWPNLSKSLKILRVTGGEPLIQKSTNDLIRKLKEDPRPHLQLNINSNMGSSTFIINTFCNSINELVSSKSIQSFKLYTSIDTWGPQAEYIRTGLKISQFEKNILHYLENTQSPLTFMITFNLFSLFSFKELLVKILDWRKRFSSKSNSNLQRIRFDISYLKEPLQYDFNLLPKDLSLPLLESSLKFMKENVGAGENHKFSPIEYQKLLRIYEYMRATNYSYSKLKQGREEFIRFFTEMDKRRGTDLKSSFPELESFLCLIKKKSVIREWLHGV